MNESVSEIDSSINAIVEEPVIPQPEQPIISTKEIFMPSSPTVAATSLDELLTYHDTDFIHCAYVTLLGRAPDPDGMRYYLGRIRAGRAKIEIIDQIASSLEAKALSVSILGLQQALRRYRWEKIPIIGLVVRSMRRQDEITRQMRIIENKLFIFSNDVSQHFKQMETTIDSLHYLIAKQLSERNEFPLDMNSFEINTSDAQHLSPRAREIFLQLKTAMISKNKGGK
jgi:hypothetical protein